ncbi:MAG: propionyl-CoA synthetase [Bacteroidetes bacterium]|nr:propionyl-CoA synthetase [Bacteroidota bacterium]
MTYSDFNSQWKDNPELFWQDKAKAIHWFRFPDQVLEKRNEHFYNWFADGLINTSYLALDYHVESGRGDQQALIYDSPVTGVKKQFTYKELLDEVELVAGMLHSIGVKKGDRVIIYMPMIPETVFAMLACARIGAVHGVVFGGFAPSELAIRINNANAKVVLTASGAKEIEKIIAYKPIVDKAIELVEHEMEHVVVFQRDMVKAELDQKHDVDWMELRKTSNPMTYVPLLATDPLYILYTSGTTGTPKGVVRDNGGHAVALKYSMDYIYNAKPGDVYWAGSDLGWVVGHSYIVYAPLIQGCTTVLYEGKPVRTPDAGAFWRVMEEYGVNIFFTAPTAFRAIKKEDPNGLLKAKYDTSGLKYLFLAGERCDVTTLKWLEDLTKVPVIDHWWQTESGWPMISQMAGCGLYDVKPGSAGKAVVGYNFHVLDHQLKEAGINQEGALVLDYPLPPGTLYGLWNNTPRYINSYLRDFPSYFASGDGAYMDDEGYIFITGRMDDIINVAGHRLSTSKMEEVVAKHACVAECAVIGVNDTMKGEIPVGFVIMKQGYEMEPEVLQAELISDVRAEIGPVAAFKKVLITTRLPKTRSGKILRKTMRHIANEEEFKMPATIEDPEVLAELADIMNVANIEVI